MKQYPSISHVPVLGQSVYAFAKEDGSNIRAELDKKKGFFKFGSRTRLLGSDQVSLSKAEDLIRANEKEFIEIANANRWESAIFFFEYFGPKSFAGQHHPYDDHKVVLIEANPYKKGLIHPKDFVALFADKVETAKLLYHGICTEEFVAQVQNSELEGMPFEGVVCKFRGKGDVFDAFKIKSRAWLDKLRAFVNNDEKLFAMMK